MRSTATVDRRRKDSVVEQDVALRSTPLLPTVLPPSEDQRSGHSTQVGRLVRRQSGSYWPGAATVVSGLPDQPLSQDEANVLFEWSGVVERVGDDYFVARITPIGRDGAEEEAVFDIADIDDEDAHLLTDGALFFWRIGYVDENGQRRRFSELRIRRIMIPDEPRADWFAQLQRIVTPAGETRPTEG